jgi:hypothetical protein
MTQQTKTAPSQDDIMAELNSDSEFTEQRLPLERRIAYVRVQIGEWNDIAYTTKVAYQTNKAIGVTVEELAPLIAQFSRARAAIKELETRLAELQKEQPAQQSVRTA